MEGFKLSEYIKSGLLEAVGRLPSYEIKIASTKWFEKGVLIEDDLAEIQIAIENHNNMINEANTIVSTEQ